MAHIKVSGNYIEIHGVYPSGGSYDISFDQINKTDGLNEWVDHLREKNWWTKDLEAEFMKVVIDHNGKV